MKALDFIDKMKKIQSNFLIFIENEKDSEENFQIFDDDQINLFNQHEIKMILKLISRISNNHCRPTNFFPKIEKVLQQIFHKNRPKFENDEIFTIFKGNKRILLFLFEEKIISMNDYIASFMKEEKYLKKQYPHYFFNEIKSFIDDELKEEIAKQLPENYEEKRKKGENDSHICELIRDDMIDEFISFVNQNNFDLNSMIEDSIFETNSLLMKYQSALIEYSAFFGSTQIFKYLYMNGVNLSPSLWIYAIHSENPELINLLEQNKVIPFDNSLFCEGYNECLKEAIKCHHNDMANYLQNNYIEKNESDFDDNIISYSFHYCNYSYFPSDIGNNKFIFYYACQFDYLEIVEFYIKNKKVNLTTTIKIPKFLILHRVFINIFKWRFKKILF